MQCQEDFILISAFTRDKQIKETEFDDTKGPYQFIVVHFISPSIWCVFKYVKFLQNQRSWSQNEKNPKLPY